eukprot:Seg474.1 transcript_id=Seg474.1/GoldUCD/mRNA.D3Y31 product="hypothetical protein" protein_id=Seg474.1/GoldUCD/D3Y31
MKQSKIIRTLICILLFTFGNEILARHLDRSDEPMFSEEFESDEDELISAKFRPEEIENFLKSKQQHKLKIQESDEDFKPVGFAEASPDILLERLIDEEDNEKGILNGGEEQVDAEDAEAMKSNQVVFKDENGKVLKDDGDDNEDDDEYFDSDLNDSM